MMLESERVLGPRWSLKELRTFYILLKAHGRQWEKLEERLPRRSGAMVRALFEMHRGYLSLPEASVEGFCAIMMDHYESVDDIPQQKYKQEEDNKRPSGQDDMDMSEDVKTENGQEGAPAQRSRKKRRLEKLLDYDQLATLRIRSEGDMQLRRADSGEQNEVLGTLKRLGKKSEAPLKARAWLPRGEESDETGLSKVKGARFDLPWTHWFYSYVDVDFFRHNEFMECLTRMGLGKITAAARPIWSSVRTSMGHPRRLSPLFFAQEKTKLETYRAVKRRFDPSHLPDGTWPYQCPASLHPGAAVIEDVTWSDEATLPTDTLSAEQMRWAIDFLSSSQKKAASVVAKSALQVVNDGIAPPTQGASVSEGRRRVLPDTMQLIAKCVTLMSVLHRQGAAAPEVPPVITQKLVERVLELLKPSHEMNMDLYAELRAAAEGVQVQVVTQPSANAND
ncbi:hypothetical protein BBO99_00008762 [Phytophthora kernoviae]|uniref:DIRP domain-containing protein n=2 Tax=Phytophthora kernoviae TaxID=325452 RepID=A0A3R7GQM0_9STRA|nr:hypothetical protein G195_005505 [Phytophthora kernoviae 00238/432]KAG2524828.1 hypothetical protein JM16_004785 [Phytophthora kernoviae]KAG2526570.1 hypothetical protein JM18_004337 [Phytophthora kernoviae]RLN31390.1 hypothetical protein BBI17_008799 [Phytophthora kernoviae]RLN74751.1 hypothetical protein BBO99_00008762 [Phytophthora kernoviae]